MCHEYASTVKTSITLKTNFKLLFKNWFVLLQIGQDQSFFVFVVFSLRPVIDAFVILFKRIPGSGFFNLNVISKYCGKKFSDFATV